MSICLRDVYKRQGLETTEKGGVRQSIRNCLTVFQRDPLLSGAIAYNILTDRSGSEVRAWEEDIMLPTYEIGEEEKNPIFLEKRVYQGSCGAVYPYPCLLYTSRCV